MLESLACGTPVAAFPVLGPVDVIGAGGAGILHENLAIACVRALEIPREKARSYAEQFSWGKSIDQFARNLTPATVA
jgi:glycosyltransferase involved in cell wall biosynthesis